MAQLSDANGSGMTTRQAGGIALVLVVISMFLSVVFRGIELLEERRNLALLHDLQDASLQQATRLRHQFDVLASGVMQLAAAGDDSAKGIVEEMRRQGVALKPAKP